MIHPSADVSPDARIGDRTKVWHRAQIREGATVGDDCIVGKDAYIDAGVRVGDRVKIQNAALVYHGVTVESAVFIGPGVILTNDREPRATAPDGAPASADDWVVTETRLGYGCSLGAGAIVVAGSDVGRFAMVGAGAVVVRSVPEHALVAGNPARQLGWVCVCGRRLRDDAGKPFSVGASGTATCVHDARRYRVSSEVCAAAEPSRDATEAASVHPEAVP